MFLGGFSQIRFLWSFGQWEEWGTMSVVVARRDPNPPYPPTIHTVPSHYGTVCMVPCHHTHCTILYTIHTGHIVHPAHTHYTLHTVPYSPTAHPADYSPCSGPLVTNRMLQATNITIEDRWQGGAEENT